MKTGVLVRIFPERSEPPPPRPHVNKDRAMLCADCPALYEADGHPCPACGSPHAFPLAKWIDREPGA